MFALQSWIWIAPNVVVRPTVEAAVLHVRDVVGDKVVAQDYLPLSASFRISIMAAGVIILVEACCFRTGVPCRRLLRTRPG